MTIKTLATSMAALMTLALGTAHANAEIGQPEVASDSVETVVVTAQRREEDIQKIGAAISAVDGATLEHARVLQPLNLMDLTPALSAVNTTSDGSPVFSIRGVGLDDFNPNNSGGTAVYLDNIYAGSQLFLSGQLFDMQRAEVVKGPQATLYGRNATGGAINLISRMPTDSFDAYLTAGYGRWDSRRVLAAVSGPIGEGWSARLAASVEDQGERWQTDIDTGRKFGKLNREAARALLRYQSEGAFSALFNIHGSRDKSQPSSPQSFGNIFAVGPGSQELLDTGSSDPSKVRVGDLDLDRSETGSGIGLTLNYEVENSEVSLITGWDRYHREVTDTVDGIPGPSFDLLQDDKARQMYAELRAVSKEPVFDGRTDWLLGISYVRTRFRGRDASDQSAPFVGQFSIPPDFVTTGLSVAQADYTQIANSWGVYAQTTTRLLPALRLIVGGRYSKDRNTFEGVSTETGLADGGVLFQGIGSTVASLDGQNTKGSFSYRGGLEFDITNQVMLYANLSSAFKAGTYYASPALDPAAWRYVNPEKVRALEAGLKSTWFDRRLQLNLAAFDYSYRDRQSLIIFISPASGFPVGSLANVPKSKITGGELEMVWQLIPQIELTAGMSYLDSRVTRTLDNVGGAPLFTPVPEGSRLSQAPRTSYVAALKYHLPELSNWKPSIDVNGRWTSKQVSTISDPNGVYGSTRQFNARVGLVSPTAEWEVSAWGRNLTDENSITYASSDFYGGTTVWRQQPRSYGIEVTRSF